MRERRPAATPPRHFWIVPAFVSFALLGWSLTFASYGDEGFHLVASSRINAGELPYRDFFYQHVPLYAYVCAAWTRVFGQTWRAAHALSALVAGACVVLVARYVFRLVPSARWRYPAGLVSSLLLGLHFHFIAFATVGQPYAVSLTLGFISFLALSATVRTKQSSFLIVAGLCAGAAAASSLLALPVPLIELMWLARHCRGPRLVRSVTRFAAGTAVSFAPFLWLAVQAPSRTFFDVIEYQALYRGAARFDRTFLLELAKIAAAPLKSPQALLLGALAAIGYFFLRDRKEWSDADRAELRLAGWLVAGLCAYLLTPYPTFAQYFVLVVPFLAVLAGVGVYALGSRLWPEARPHWLCLVVVGTFAAGLGRAALTNRGLLSSNWIEAEPLASMAEAVTAPGAPIYFKDDRLYYAAGRLPPPGFGNQFGLDLPAAAAARAGVPSRAEVDVQLAGGRFVTVLLPCDDERIDAIDLRGKYANSRVLMDRASCMFWGPLNTQRPGFKDSPAER